MGKKDTDKIKRIMAVLLCAFIFIAFTPYSTLALEGESAEAVVDADLIPVEPEAAAPTDGTDDPDELLEGYMDVKLKEELGSGSSSKQSLRKKAAAAKRRERLNDNEKIIYDGLKELIDAVAAGEQGSTVAEIDLTDILKEFFVQKTVSGVTYNVITSQSLGISSGVCVKKYDDGEEIWTFSDEAKAKLYDFNLIIGALMADEPYTFYWYDKTRETGGVFFGIQDMLIGVPSADIYLPADSAPVLNASFTVAAAYRAEEAEDEENLKYTADISKTAAASIAVTNAAVIISSNMDVSDWDKLIAYKDWICEHTSYNHAAIIDNWAYGDPWQLIYVFDGDTSTNVVCEGYAKAFQYLCDNTDFSSSLIECNSVTGMMYRGTSSGKHMWNIICMDDEENYIADITNSDHGTVGWRGGLFLSKAMAGGSVNEGYGYDLDNDDDADITYVYDDDTLELFSENELIMALADYSGPHEINGESAVYEWAEDGSHCTAVYECYDSDEVLRSDAAVTSKVKVPASCEEPGITTYTAKFRHSELETQTKDIADIPALGHSFSTAVTKAASEGVSGLMTYTCARCGAVRTEVIPAIVYPQDLPAVKIVKPKAGKKKATIKWKKVSKKNQKKIQGIEIQVATDPGFTNIVKTAKGSKKKTSKVVKGLKKKTKYYVRIRAYKNAADGKHVSAWKTKKVKIK